LHNGAAIAPLLQTKAERMKKILLVAALVAATGLASTAQMNMGQPDRIGNMKTGNFQKKNAKGGEKVAAIKPTTGTATETDKQLMMQVAAGGMKQLMVSQAVLAKATNPKVKLLAQSEVEEQTGVSNKLKELASAKGVTLPSAPDAETQRLVTQAQGLSGTQLDQFYLAESGVKGHQELEATMTTVASTAGLKEMRKLAAATLPVIRMHLEVSQAEMKMMTGGPTAQR
jgi:putative membrane protein